MVPVIIGFAAAAGLLIHNLTTTTFVLDPGAGTHAWVDVNENGVPDFDEEEEFTPADQGDYRRTSATELIRTYEWESHAFLAILGAFLMVALRDLGYMYRIRLLSDRAFSWRKSFDVIMLWEFASALTPSIVGGSGVAIFVLNREGMNFGRATSVVFITALMDELFYIIAVPLVFIIIGPDRLFPSGDLFGFFTPSFLKSLFYFGYLFIVSLTTFILLGIFFYPRQTKYFLVRLFSLGFLRRWQRHMVKLGDEIILSSQHFRGKSLGFWAKAMGATIVSWTARFATLNFIFLAFIGGFDQLEVYGRQLVMWVILLISVTPGSSGIAELLLPAFFGYLPDLAPVLLALVAIIWRLLTYFPYLFVGAAVLPGWLRRTARKRRKVDVAI
jgi:uncharacterized protein (TIRG00374 family)